MILQLRDSSRLNSYVNQHFSSSTTTQYKIKSPISTKNNNGSGSTIKLTPQDRMGSGHSKGSGAAGVCRSHPGMSRSDCIKHLNTCGQCRTNPWCRTCKKVFQSRIQRREGVQQKQAWQRRQQAQYRWDQQERERKQLEDKRRQREYRRMQQGRRY